MPCSEISSSEISSSGMSSTKSLSQFSPMLYFVGRKLVRHCLSKPLAVFRVELRVFCASFHHHVQKCPPQKFLHSNVSNWKLGLFKYLLKFSVWVFWLGYLSGWLLDLLGQSVYAICLGNMFGSLNSWIFKIWNGSFSTKLHSTKKK
jgi:hypothetical protein